MARSGGAGVTPKCVLKWPGGKWAIAGWIAEQLPRTPVYLELFFGGGGVLAARDPSIVEVANDLDDQVVNFFEVLRERPEHLAAALELTPWSRTEWESADEPRRRGRPSQVECARLFLVRQWQSHGHRCMSAGWRHDGPTRDDYSITTTWRKLPDRVRTLAERMRSVQFENRPALELLARYNDTNVLVYADPPYLGATRRNKKLYRHEMMGEPEHEQLLDALDTHAGPVALSHYRCGLYDKMLERGWAVETISTLAEHGKRTVEALYTNPALQALVGRRQLLLGGAASIVRNEGREK